MLYLVSHFPLAWRRAEGPRARVLISTGVSPLSGEMQANPMSHRVYLFIYIYASTAVLFAMACEGWVLGETFEGNNKKSTEST